MPPWLLAIIGTLVTLILGLLGYFLREAHQEIRLLHDQVRSHDQELYGAKGNNGQRQHLKDLEAELSFQGAMTHWIKNLVTVLCEKADVEPREIPKRGDQRR